MLRGEPCIGGAVQGPEKGLTCITVHCVEKGSWRCNASGRTVEVNDIALSAAGNSPVAERNDDAPSASAGNSPAVECNDNVPNTAGSSPVVKRNDDVSNVAGSSPVVARNDDALNAAASRKRQSGKQPRGGARR